MWRWHAGPYTSGGATRVVGLYFRFGFWLHRMGIEPRTCTFESQIHQLLPLDS